MRSLSQPFDIVRPYWVLLVGTLIGPAVGGATAVIIVVGPDLVFRGPGPNGWMELPILAIFSALSGLLFGFLPGLVATAICIVPWGGQRKTTLLRVILVATAVGAIAGLAAFRGGSVWPLGAILVGAGFFGSIATWFAAKWLRLIVPLAEPTQ